MWVDDVLQDEKVNVVERVIDNWHNSNKSNYFVGEHVKTERKLRNYFEKKQHRCAIDNVKISYTPT